MTPSEIDAAVHSQLGELRAVTKGLQASLERIEEMMQRSEDKSDESRSKMHKRVDELVDRVAAVETNVTSVQGGIQGIKKEIDKDIKPTVEEVKRWKLIGIGALGMIGIAGIALGVSFADAIKRIFGLLIGKM